MYRITIVGSGFAALTAVQRAKEKLAIKQPQALDVLLGWTLLGDPTLVLIPAGR